MIKTMKGFTLIELVLTIAILGILTAIAINTFGAAQLKKEQSGITESIVSYLEKQKADTQAGKGGKNYGIKFDSDTFTLFEGKVYSLNATTNITFPINPNFEISETISNASNAIYFFRLYGEANETATITISHINNQITPQLIVIEESGTISVIE